MDKKTPILDFSKLTPEQFKIADLVVEAAEAYKIDPNLLLAQAFRESGFRHIPSEDPNSDAFGVMQIRPSTGKLNKLGDIRDLRTNVYGGAQLMRNYLDEYKSPEAALLAYHQGPGVADIYIKSKGDLKAVGPKGLDYVIDIGNNGGFGQPAKSEDASKEPDPNNPFAVGVPLADKAREASRVEAEQKAMEEEEKRRNPPPKTLLDRASEAANEIDPQYAALAGAAANLFLPMPTNPQVSPKVDTSKAVEANLSAQDKLDLARQKFQESAPQNMFSLEESYRQNQDELERLKNEQRLADARLKGLPKTPPIMDVPAPFSSLPQVDVSRTGRASGPKIEGDSGTRNWMIQEAGQQHQLPEAVLNIATDKTKESPTGGKALINKDLANLETKKRLGLGDYGLITLPSGVQLDLPPTTVAERQADIDKQNQANQAEIEQRAEQARIQQAAQAQQLEQQRLAHEADLERIRQQRSQLGQQQNVLSGQVKAVAPLQRALTKAEMDAEIAKRKLLRAQQQPNTFGRALENTGVASTKIGPVGRTVTGGLAGVLGLMSYQEALERAKAGDTSEAVLNALAAGSAGLAVLPPAGKKLTKARGLGTVGTVGYGGYQLGKQLLKERPQDEK